MNPSPAAVAAIRAKVADWSPDDQAVAASLNAPDRPNPTPRPTVPRPFTFADVFGCLDAGTAAKIRDLPTGTDLITKVNARDAAGVAHWVGALLDAPAVISTAEADKVMAVLQATQPDPSWPPQISWAVATLGRPVDSADVAASRPGV